MTLATLDSITGQGIFAPSVPFEYKHDPHYDIICDRGLDEIKNACFCYGVYSWDDWALYDITAERFAYYIKRLNLRYQ